MATAVPIKELQHHWPTATGVHSLLADYLRKYSKQCRPNPALTEGEANQIQLIWANNMDNVTACIWNYIYAFKGGWPVEKPAYSREAQEEMWKIYDDDWAEVFKWFDFYLEVTPTSLNGGFAISVYMYHKSTKAKYLESKVYIFRAQKDMAGAQWAVVRFKTNHGRSVEAPTGPPSFTPEDIAQLNKLADDLEAQHRIPDDSDPGPTPAPNPIPNPNPNPIPNPNPKPHRPQGILPPNVSSGFGGVDASCAAFSMEGFKPNLFNLDISDPAQTWSFESTGTDGRTTYSLPKYLNFTWTTIDDFFSATGSSKRDFIRDLSGHLNLGVSILGFGAEFKRTFSEESKEETFTKYLARYDTSLVYRVGFKDPDTAKDYLSVDAKAALATWEPTKFVQVFGTHYMTEACFGGMRIHSSTLDTLDTFTKSDLKDAIDITVSSLLPPSDSTFEDEELVSLYGQHGLQTARPLGF